MPVPCTPPVIGISSSVLCVWEVEIFMARLLHQDSSPSVRRIHGCILAVFWTSGLLSGIWAFFDSGGFLSSLMLGSVIGSVSIVSLLCVTVLPFLLSACAVFLSCRGLLFPLAFFRAFLVSYVGMGIYACFGSAGWLFRLFLCFSELLSTPLLYWFWLRCCDPSQGRIVPQCALTGAFCLLIGSIDYCLISPQLRNLIIL